MDEGNKNVRGRHSIRNTLIAALSAAALGVALDNFERINFFHQKLYNRIVSHGTNDTKEGADDTKELEKKVAEYAREFGRNLTRYNPATGREQPLPGEGRREATIPYLIDRNDISRDGRVGYFETGQVKIYVSKQPDGNLSLDGVEVLSGDVLRSGQPVFKSEEFLDTHIVKSIERGPQKWKGTLKQIIGYYESKNR